MGRFDGTSKGQDTQTGWRTAGSLAPRQQTPCTGSFDRLMAGPKRRQSLEQIFSSERMLAGSVFAVTGPAGAGKSAVALAACDLRGYRACFATVERSVPALKPQEGMCVIIDPVSAFDPKDVLACVNSYRGVSPVILVDRHETALKGVVQAGDAVWQLKLPSPNAIGQYISDMLAGYEHTLRAADLQQLGETLHGLSLAQVNQITNDAALSRLQHAEPIDRRAFDEAVTAYARLRQQA